MARSALLFLVASCMCAAAYAAGTYEVLQDTSYTQLKPVAGQWKISVSATKSADKAVFSPIACDQPALTAPCNQPQLTADNMDKLKVELQLKNKTLTTYDNLAPKRLLVRACYTKASAVDRPWRKAADKIDMDKSCPFVIKSTEYDAGKATYAFEWPVPKNMTKATWFTSVLVQCTNGTGNSYCQHDSTVNQTYFATNIINSTPTGMVVATAVCSAIGPLFLGVYFLRDMITRRGKSSS